LWPFRETCAEQLINRPAYLWSGSGDCFASNP
jgi:hypothetical protein